MICGPCFDGNLFHELNLLGHRAHSRGFIHKPLRIVPGGDGVEDAHPLECELIIHHQIGSRRKNTGHDIDVIRLTVAEGAIGAELIDRQVRRDVSLGRQI